jgi:hypothetical protein
MNEFETGTSLIQPSYETSALANSLAAARQEIL